MNFFVNFLLVILFGFSEGNFGFKSRHDAPGSLYLTPYIKSQKISEVRNLSIVDGYDAGSHSGFFTVDQDTHLFGWFYNSIKNDEKVPLVIWPSGSPIDENIFESASPLFPDLTNVQNSKYSILNTHSLFMIHSTPGIGFSHSETPDNYSKSHDQIAQNVLKVLEQFFLMFPEQKTRRLFIGGVGGSAKIATLLAYKISNSENFNDIMRLQGLILGNPFIHPEVQVRSSDFLYYSGLVDQEHRTYFENDEQTIVDLIKNGKHEQAANFWDILYEKSEYLNRKSTFETFTGYKSTYNLLETTAEPQYFSNLRQTFESRSFRHMIHVDEHLPLREFNSKVKRSMIQDITTSVKPQLEEILSQKKVNILIYSGVLNVKYPSTNVQEITSSLVNQNFGNFSRKIWVSKEDGGEVGGWVKHSRNLFEVLIRNSGQLTNSDQPKWLYKLFNIFTGGHRGHGHGVLKNSDFEFEFL